MKIHVFLLTGLVAGTLFSQSETRYALSVTDEGGFAGGLRVPGADTSNLILIEPSFALKQGDRWRFSTSLVALSRASDDTHEQVRVREAYLGVTAGALDVTIGKRLLRWGTGYAFTATGVLDPPRSSTDPTDRLGLNPGREMVKADWVAGKHDFTVAWASAGLLDSHRPGLRETLAFRYNAMLDGFDTSLIVAHERGGSTFTGANFTRVVGSAVEVHGELAWRDAGAVLFGGKYTHRTGVTAIAEYYTLLAAPSARQHYGFIRAGKSRLRERPGWKEWDLTVSLVSNLADHSRVAVLDAGRRFGNHCYAYTHVQSPAGKRGHSEYGAIPYSALVSIGVTFQM